MVNLLILIHHYKCSYFYLIMLKLKKILTFD
jgi:hypothetical protein